jgi:hypothetical protein
MTAARSTRANDELPWSEMTPTGEGREQISGYGVINPSGSGSASGAVKPMATA